MSKKNKKKPSHENKRASVTASIFLNEAAGHAPAAVPVESAQNKNNPLPAAAASSSTNEKSSAEKTSEPKTGWQRLTSQLEQVRMVDAYSHTLENADGKILDYYKEAIQNSKDAYTNNKRVQVAAFIIAIFVLFLSIFLFFFLSLTNSYKEYLSLLAFIGSIVIIWKVITNNSFSNVRQEEANKIKLNVMFLGYLRQISMIDASFKRIFLSSENWSSDEMKKWIQSVQESRDAIIEEINHASEETFQ